MYEATNLGRLQMTVLILRKLFLGFCLPFLAQNSTKKRIRLQFHLIYKYRGVSK